MSDIESSFSKLLGRQPSQNELESLYRVKNALGIQENDALWLVLMSLESYSTLLGKLPAQMHDQVLKTVDTVKDAARTAVEAESKRAMLSLAEAVSDTSKSIANSAVEAQRVVALCILTVGILLFGTLCLVLGFILGSGRIPGWAFYPQDASPIAKMVSSLLLAPAGWLLPVIGVGFCVYHIVHSAIERRKPSTPAIASFVALTLLSALVLFPFF